MPKGVLIVPPRFHFPGASLEQFGGRCFDSAEES
jgi:hypothetical protein